MRSLSLLLSLCAATADAQNWTPVPLNTSADLFAIENTHLPRHWVVGASGFAAWSNDDRTDWTIMDPGTQANLYAVAEPAGLDVWMGAGQGVVRRRVYNMWFERDLPIQEDFRLFTRASSAAIAVGADGQVLRTTNGGNDWNPLSTGTAVDLNAGAGIPENWLAWIVGDDGTILRTADGDVWSSVESGTTADLYGIAELNLTDIFVVGDGGTILKSTDGGLTWDLRSSGTTAQLRAISISKQSASVLIAVGLGGTVLRSTDAGDSWCSLDVTTTDLFAAEAVNDTEFLVGGQGGLLLRTTNGGGLCSAAGIDVGDEHFSTKSTVRLVGPFPQPSTDLTTMRLRAAEGQWFRTEVFDASGRLRIASPKTRTVAGEHVIHLDTSDWESGVYLVKVRSGEWQEACRLVVTR